MLTDLSIRNYKSLRDVRLDSLPAFSVMVGANASGKSNFADALDFLSLVFRHGLTAAVSAKGGYENVCFRRTRRSKAGIRFELAAEVESRTRRKTERVRFEYSFGFRTAGEAITADYYVTHESLRASHGDPARRLLSVERGTDGKVQIDVAQDAEDDFRFPSADPLREYLMGMVPDDELIVPSRLLFRPVREFVDFMGGGRVYQISPHIAREPGVPQKSPELGKHGENLPAAVEFLERSDHDSFDELQAHLKYAVSTMESLETDYVETKELGLFFKERAVGRRWYSQDVSDGTMKTVSMFLPLVDARISMLVIEEPENSLHPWILRHFMDACQKSDKQVFVTTHSPVAVDSTPLESLFVVSRRGGETSIGLAERLAPDARTVIHSELYGLGEYWDSGAMGGVPEPD